MITERELETMGYVKQELKELSVIDGKTKQLVSWTPGPVVMWKKGNYGLIIEYHTPTRTSFARLWIADMALMENICVDSFGIRLHVPCNNIYQLYCIDQLLDQWTKEALSRRPSQHQQAASSQNY